MKKSSVFEPTIAVISILIAAITLYFTMSSARHEKGGSLEARYNNTVVDNDISRTVFVCMDSFDALTENVVLTPVFNNVSEYSIKDFSLEYMVESSGVSFTPTDFYRKFEYGRNKNVYRYEYNTLSPYSESQRPFMSVRLEKSGAHCLVTAKATYDGAAKPFNFMTDIRFIVVDNSAAHSFDDWKLSCKKKMFSYVNDQFLDVCYCYQGNVLSEMNVVVNDVDSNPQRNSVPVESRTVTQTQSSVPDEGVEVGSVNVVGEPLLSAENMIRGKAHSLYLTYTPDLTDRVLHLYLQTEKSRATSRKFFLFDRKNKKVGMVKTVTLPAGSESIEIPMSATHEFDINSVRVGKKMKNTFLVHKGISNGRFYLRDFSNQRKMAHLSVVKDGKTYEYLFEIPYRQKRYVGSDTLDVLKDDFTCTIYRVPGKSLHDILNIIYFWFCFLMGLGLLFTFLVQLYWSIVDRTKDFILCMPIELIAAVFVFVSII